MNGKKKLSYFIFVLVTLILLLLWIIFFLLPTEEHHIYRGTFVFVKGSAVNGYLYQTGQESYIV